MHYIYFLPKQVSLYTESKPWGYPMRVGFKNKRFALHYIEELRKHGYKAFLTEDNHARSLLHDQALNA